MLQEVVHLYSIVEGVAVLWATGGDTYVCIREAVEVCCTAGGGNFVSIMEAVAV